MWDRDGCWCEKDWDRPRLAWCRSRRSLTAGLDGLFLPETWGKTNKQHYHFLSHIKSTDSSEYLSVPRQQQPQPQCAYVTTAERPVGGLTQTLWTVASASCADSAAEGRHGTGHVLARLIYETASVWVRKWTCTDLVQPRFEDLKGHTERQRTPFLAMAEITERGVTDHSWQWRVFTLTTTWAHTVPTVLWLRIYLRFE